MVINHVLVVTWGSQVWDFASIRGTWDLGRRVNGA